eukprot:gene16291-7677_t
MSSKSGSGSSESLLEETSSSELDYDIEHDDRAMSPGGEKGLNDRAYPQNNTASRFRGEKIERRFEIFKTVTVEGAFHQ